MFQGHLTQTLLYAAALCCLAVAIYAASFHFQWTYDDYAVVLENPDIRSLDNFLNNHKKGRPVRELSYLLDYSLFGLKPAGYHLQNIFWHACNGLLLMWLGLRLGLSRFLAFGAAALFVAHPLTVEVVANTGHRKDSLALFFVLLAVHLYLKAIASVGSRRWLALGGSVVLWLVAVQAKQHAIMLPVMIAGHELIRRPVAREFMGRHKKAVLAISAAAFVLVCIAIVMFGAEPYQEAAQKHLLRFGYFGDDIIPAHLLLASKALVSMLLKVVLPIGLAIEYAFVVPESWWDPWVLAALAFVAAWGLALWKARDHRVIVFGLLWALLFWFPASNLLPLSYYAADRYLYAPLGGFSLAFVGLLALIRHPEAMRRAQVGLLVLVVVLALTSRVQVRYWADETSLWTRAYQVSPTSVFAMNNMGLLHFERGELEEAVALFERCVALTPSNPTCQYNLGWYYESRGELPKAMSYYRVFMNIRVPTFHQERKDLRERLKVRYGVDLEKH